MWNPWLQNNGPLPSNHDIRLPPPGHNPMQQYGGNPSTAERQATHSPQNFLLGTPQAFCSPQPAPTFVFDMICGSSPSPSSQLPSSFPQMSPPFDQWRSDPPQVTTNFAVNAVLSGSFVPGPGGLCGPQKFNLHRLSGFGTPMENNNLFGSANEPHNLVTIEPSIALQKQRAPPPMNDQPLGTTLFIQPVMPAGGNNQDRQSAVSFAGDSFQMRNPPSYNARHDTLDFPPKRRTGGRDSLPAEQKGTAHYISHRRCSSCHADIGRSQPQRANRASKSISRRSAPTSQLAEHLYTEEEPVAEDCIPPSGTKYIRDFVSRLRRNCQFKNAFIAQCHQFLPAYAKRSKHAVHDTLELMKADDRVLVQHVVELFQSLWNKGPVAAVLMNKLFYILSDYEFPSISESKKSERHRKQVQVQNRGDCGCEKDYPRDLQPARKYKKTTYHKSSTLQAKRQKPTETATPSSGLSSSSDCDDGDESNLSEQMSEVSLVDKRRPVNVTDKNVRPEQSLWGTNISAASVLPASEEPAWKSMFNCPASSYRRKDTAVPQTEYIAPVGVPKFANISHPCVSKTPQSRADTAAHNRELQTKEGNEGKRNRMPGNKRSTTEGEILDPADNEAQPGESSFSAARDPKKRKLKGSPHTGTTRAKKNADPPSALNVWEGKTLEESSRQPTDGKESESAAEKTGSMLQRKHNIIAIFLAGKWYHVYKEVKAVLEVEGLFHPDVTLPWGKISLNSQTTANLRNLLSQRGLLQNDRLDENVVVKVVEVQQANAYYKRLLGRKKVNDQTNDFTPGGSLAENETDDSREPQTQWNSDDTSSSSAEEECASVCSKVKRLQRRNKQGQETRPKQTEDSARNGDDQKPTKEDLRLDLSSLPKIHTGLSSSESDPGVPELLCDKLASPITPFSSQSSDSDTLTEDSCHRGRRRWSAKKLDW